MADLNFFSVTARAKKDITSGYIKGNVRYLISLLSGVMLCYCFTPLYNGAPISRLLRHAGDTEDVFST